MAQGSLKARVAALDWPRLEAQLWERGHAHTPRLLTAAGCRALAALYGEDRRFRNRVDMARHRFGEGGYAYFAEPLPEPVAELREALYARLAPIANRMMAALKREARYPATLAGFLKRCAAAGQTRPTPLLLHYRRGGHNRLHRDLYGELHFPLQAVAMLSRPGVDYEGGEFLLVENRPRQQALGEAVTVQQGELLIFPVYERPVAKAGMEAAAKTGARGMLRAQVRHGVSTVRKGERHTLGIIFHNAR